MEGITVLDDNNPYEDHERDKGYFLLFREQIFHTLAECYESGVSKTAHQSIKHKRGRWKVKNESMNRRRRRIYAWIRCPRFILYLQNYRLDPELFCKFLHDLLQGERRELAEQLLERYNIHVKRGRKKTNA